MILKLAVRLQLTYVLAYEITDRFEFSVIRVQKTNGE